MGYSKAPEQPQSTARPICHSHAMTSAGRKPATIRIAAYRSSPRYALGRGRRLTSYPPYIFSVLEINRLTEINLTSNFIFFNY